MGIAEGAAAPGETVIHGIAYDIVSEFIGKSIPIKGNSDRPPNAYVVEKLKKPLNEAALQQVESLTLDEDKKKYCCYLLSLILRTIERYNGFIIKILIILLFIDNLIR